MKARHIHLGLNLAFIVGALVTGFGHETEMAMLCLLVAGLLFILLMRPRQRNG